MMNIIDPCRLCPRRCGARRLHGERGFCGGGSSARIARAALHLWEEPCISGTNGSGTVFFSGCTLKCMYCQNYEVSAHCLGKDVSVSELSEEFLRLQSMGAHNINLVTPMHYAPMIVRAVETARAGGLRLPIVCNTGGYDSIDALKILKGYVDIYLPDFKYWDEKYALEYSAAPGYRETAIAAIEEMLSQIGKPVFDGGIMKKGVIIRHLMLPGLLFDTKKIIDCICDRFGDDIYISIMSQYTPLEQVLAHPRLSKRLNPKHYEAMLSYCAEKGITNAFVQSGDSADEGFIPRFYGTSL